MYCINFDYLLFFAIIEMIGIENHMKSVQVDFESVCYFAYKDLSDVLSVENIQLIRESYSNVLEVIEKECVICFSSKGAMDMHAKWVRGILIM